MLMRIKFEGFWVEKKNLITFETFSPADLVSTVNKVLWLEQYKETTSRSEKPIVSKIDIG